MRDGSGRRPPWNLRAPTLTRSGPNGIVGGRAGACGRFVCYKRNGRTSAGGLPRARGVQRVKQRGRRGGGCSRVTARPVHRAVDGRRRRVAEGVDKELQGHEADGVGVERVPLVHLPVPPTHVRIHSGHLDAAYMSKYIQAISTGFVHLAVPRIRLRASSGFRVWGLVRV